MERLAAAPQGLPASLAKALVEDLEYARLGAALLDLPWYGNPGAELARVAFGHAAPLPPRHELLRRAPVAVGLRLSEIVSRGALVGREPGLAFVAGYFTHLAMERRVVPLVLQRLGIQGTLRAPEHHALRGVEWVQALLWLRETLGHDPMGTEEITQRFRVVKRRGFPVRGLGKGMFLLIETAYLDVLGETPTKAEVDAWVRGMWIHGRILGSSIGKRISLPEDVPHATSSLYRGEGIDLAHAIEVALDDARACLVEVVERIEHNDFREETTAAFLRTFPEESAQVEGEAAETAVAPVPAPSLPEP
jgi:hypothetical protein